MRVYADTSFIVALYLQQESSPVAAAFMQRHGQALPFTPWHRLETRNALRLAVFHQIIDSRQARIQLRQLDADLREATLIVHTTIDWVSVLRRAEELGGSHNESLGCRSGDLFHVAAAVVLDAELFLTFDARQRQMAEAAGLAVKS
ncbi:MAG: hypothetical protein JWQ04_1248 [Pedosphaera sp.]|nr:hypothetical protein [Pedosphaera sp.]